MALRNVLACVVVVVATMWSGSSGQSSCTSALTSMTSCLNYITGSSTTPSSSCCSQLSSVVKSSPQCLCSVLNSGGSSFGITINKTLALNLPGACKVQTPPVSQCQTGGNTPTTPSTAPVGSPAESPSASDVPNAASGSKTVPSIDGASSAGTTIKVSSGSMFSLLFILPFLSLITHF